MQICSWFALIEEKSAGQLKVQDQDMWRISARGILLLRQPLQLHPPQLRAESSKDERNRHFFDGGLETGRGKFSPVITPGAVSHDIYSLSEIYVLLFIPNPVTFP